MNSEKFVPPNTTEKPKENEAGQKPVVNFTPEERKAFLKLIESGSIQGLFSGPEIRARSESLRAQGNLREPINESETSLFKKLGDFKQLASIPNNAKLTFRYVVAADNNKAANITKLAELHGGKAPADTSVGVCVNDGHKIVKYLNMRTHSEKIFVFFVYDNTKLVGLTKEERDADLNLRYYGVKPAPGLELKDALFGSIIME